MKYAFSLCLIFFGLGVSAMPPPEALPPQEELVLAKATSAILYSLEPMIRPGAGDPTLDGNLVLGSIKLNAADTAIAVAEFRKSVGTPGLRALCFLPRHALRIVSKRVTCDFLLCYQCGVLEVHRGGTRVASVGAGGSSAVLDRLMIKHGLSLSRSR